ncbi:hypothetical protein ACQ5SO_20725 [Rhodovulum sp. DZ06]|uniref:hypothetical protein n=1 Tax=Rhodovulum sp. DZ06 TaxID=3425126 RepID=UPI003D3449D9
MNFLDSVGRHSGRALLGLILVGMALRLYPLAMGPEGAAWVYMTEDGYLMATVARNMAIGLGMSVSEGTIQTNGVQPLMTFVQAACFALAGGDKGAGLMLVHLANAVISAGAIALVYLFARRALAAFSASPVFALFPAALWACGPLLVYHSMNGLETGLYHLSILAAMLLFGRLAALERETTTAERIALGALLGICFLSRNDAVFLVLAVLITRAVQTAVQGRPWKALAREGATAGAAALVFAAPWLVYNKVNFGSIVPISGSAQSTNTELGQNLRGLPTTLFEHMAPMFPVPGKIGQEPVLLWGMTAVIALVVLAYVALALRRRALGADMAAWLLFIAMLSGYYGLFFGAGHFLSRYTSPGAIPLMIALTAVAVAAARAIGRDGAEKALKLAAVGCVLLAAALTARASVFGAHAQGHRQVVEWAAANVADDTWAAAVQTGTLGFWHDRTINLDGKVNPAALKARIEEGDVFNYLVAEERIEVLVDWANLCSWLDGRNAAFAAAFEQVAYDRKANLCAIRRAE